VVNNACYKNGLDLKRSGVGEITASRSGAVDVHLVNNVAYAWNSRAPSRS
jgi:hypothetical protein